MRIFHAKGNVEEQTCPALTILAQSKRRAVSSKLALEWTKAGDLPPNSRVIDVRCFAAAVATIRPTRPDPSSD